jgi:hypothetical protein
VSAPEGVIFQITARGDTPAAAAELAERIVNAALLTVGLSPDFQSASFKEHYSTNNNWAATLGGNGVVDAS